MVLLGILLIFFNPQLEPPVKYKLTVESTGEQPVTFRASWYYYEIDGEKINKQQRLTSPFEITFETLNFRGVFENLSEQNEMKITLDDGQEQIVSTYNQAVIEVDGGHMDSWGID